MPKILRTAQFMRSARRKWRNLIVPIFIVIERSHIYSNKTLPQHSTRICSSTIRCGCITMWSHSTISCRCSTMRFTLMMIDMNGPGIEAVDEVKVLILESVNVWKNFKKRVQSRDIQAARGPCVQPEKTRNVLML